MSRKAFLFFMGWLTNVALALGILIVPRLLVGESVSQMTRLGLTLLMLPYVLYFYNNACRFDKRFDEELGKGKGAA